MQAESNAHWETEENRLRREIRDLRGYLEFLEAELLKLNPGQLEEQAEHDFQFDPANEVDLMVALTPEE